MKDRPHHYLGRSEGDYTCTRFQQVTWSSSIGLLSLNTEYEELEIDSFGFESTQFVETALRITPSTIKFLTLFTDDKCK